MSDKQKKCDHPACNCIVGSNADYCSQYCEDSAGTTEISCNCGHAGCAITEGRTVRSAGSGGTERP